MKMVPLVLVLMLVAPTGAAAQADQSADVATAEPAVPDADGEEEAIPEIIVEGEVPREKRRVCEMQTATGSIMPRRVCRTIAEIEEEQRVARESLEIIKRDRDSRGFTQLSREVGQ